MRELVKKLCSTFQRASWAVLVALLMASTGYADTSTSKQDAENLRRDFDNSPIAEEFLRYLDEGNYRKALEPPLSQFASEPEKSLLRIENLRAPLGKVTNRILAGTTFGTKIPGRSDGEYHGMIYRTEFKSNRNYLERVLLQKIDGNWMVIGYSIPAEPKPQ